MSGVITVSANFIICPQPDALESDRDKPITTLEELVERNRDMPEPEIDTHEHYTRWTMGTFLAMCEYLGLVVCDALDPDDKVGNGIAAAINAIGQWMADRLTNTGGSYLFEKDDEPLFL